MHPTPWYRQIWPWVLIALPLSAVIASIVTVYIAASGSDTLVASDYYKKGKAINQELTLQDNAAALGLQFRLDYERHDDRLFVQYVAGDLNMTTPLTLSLFHPTLADHDQHGALVSAGAGRYQLPLSGAIEGNWMLRLEPLDRSWRLEQRIALPNSDGILIGAGRD